MAMPGFVIPVFAGLMNEGEVMIFKRGQVATCPYWRPSVLPR